MELMNAMHGCLIGASGDGVEGIRDSEIRDRTEWKIAANTWDEMRRKATVNLEEGLGNRGK